VYPLAVFWDHWVVVKTALKVPTARIIAKDWSYCRLPATPPQTGLPRGYLMLRQFRLTRIYIVDTHQLESRGGHADNDSAVGK
jgi:hypothetical protein